MQYWLLKSEPDEFSIDLLKTRETEEWTGVRNYQARNFMREMKLGDQFFFYHSSCAEPGIVGVGKIARVAAPDPTQFDPESDYFDAKSAIAAPRWSSVLVSYVRHTARPIGLVRLRAAASSLVESSAVSPARRDLSGVSPDRRDLSGVSPDRRDLSGVSPDLQDFVLLNRGNRLSILPVTPTQWRAILKLEKPNRTI